MFQGFRELAAAKGRTALIIVTVMLITVLVTFLSSLAEGLSFQSVSALQSRLTSDDALVLEDNGTTTLSSSRLDDAQIKQVEDAGGEALYMARTRQGSEPVIVLSDPSRTGATDLFLDHMPVIAAPPEAVASMPGASAAAILPESSLDAAPAGTKVLTGDERWNASGSYAGEQMSLTLMINLLYVISALVLGAFFTVWTLQRLKGVTISAALGASNKVLVADSVGQAFVVLAVGIFAGGLITLGTGQLIPDTVPVVLSASTVLVPSVILAAAGLLGAAISLKPVLSISPRAALASA